MEECEKLQNCPFFKKYQSTKELVCKGFIKIYCQGSRKDECRRKEYSRKNNIPPSDDMMPNGIMMVTP
ncbi:MAG: hypothetical protein PHV30_09020 [Candidatus Margulisbacteria bacterium]|nr:hypothetical protein [Candidatus Margulisiibacteriota bacterium]